MKIHKRPPKKTERNKTALYMSILIIFIMVTSGFGVMFYGFSNPSSTVKYKDFKFKLTQQGYQTKINGNQYYFEALPQDVEDIPIEFGTKYTILNSQAVIITSDPDSAYKEELALAHYNLNQMVLSLNKNVANAFTKENENLPVVTCMNSSLQFPVIEIVESNVTEASMGDNGCVTVEFDSSFNLRRITSKIMYLILGVIDETPA